MTSCKICNRGINSELTNDGFNYLYDCAYCGKYKYAMSYEPDTYLQNVPLYKISSWIREQNDLFNNIPLLDNEKFDEVLVIRDKKIKEKFDLMMEFYRIM